MNVLKAYKFRIYPTKKQQEFFIRTFGCVRFTYNQLLMDRKENYAHLEERSQFLTPAKLKRDYPFLKEVDSLALANTQLNVMKAFRNYYLHKTSFPKYKKKTNCWQSYTTNNQHNSIRINGNQLRLPKVKSLIKIHAHRPVVGTIRSATISARFNQEFYISLLCEVPIQAMPKTTAKIGLAFSKHELLISSEALTLPTSKIKYTEEKIVRALKKLDVRKRQARRRGVPVSEAKNYQKQKRYVAMLFEKKAWQQEDYLEKISYELIKKYDYLFMERITDEASSAEVLLWHKLVKKLRYKAKWYQKRLVIVDLSKLPLRNAIAKSQVLMKTGNYWIN
ncbi:MAG: RNA-guided endonuclease TnpB family protein [Enterococcus sp.]